MVKASKDLSFECNVIEADTIKEATEKYEQLINRHMANPRTKFSQKQGQPVYMRPINHDLKMIDGEFVVKITFVATVNSSNKIKNEQ